MSDLSVMLLGDGASRPHPDGPTLQKRFRAERGYLPRPAPARRRFRCRPSHHFFPVARGCGGAWC